MEGKRKWWGGVVRKVVCINLGERGFYMHANYLTLLADDHLPY